VLNTVTNTAGHCGSTFDATRTWQATDACGKQQQLQPEGDGRRYQRARSSPVGTRTGPSPAVQPGLSTPRQSRTNSGTNAITIIGTVTNAACGSTFSATRTWQATDACGNFARCSQTVTILDTTAPVINCSANKTVQLGAAWTFDTPTASDSCSSVSVIIVGTVTNAGCGKSLVATRTWKATDACGNSAQCSQTVSVVDTTPPSVTIISPTNGAVFIAPASFTLLADAQDAGGVIRVMEFFFGTNALAKVTNEAPYFVVLTNLAPGNYTFYAKATDGCGLTATSAPVTITVAAHSAQQHQQRSIRPANGLLQADRASFEPNVFDH